MGGWSSRDRPNQFQELERDGTLTGRVAVVTGASDGLGYATAVRLAGMGARTILACRNEEKTRQAMGRMREELAQRGLDESAGQLEFMSLDLSSFQATRAFVDEFKRKGIPIHILVNNAAIAMVPFIRTQDGYESQYQVNHLSHFLLTLELLPCLQRAAQERGGARVVVVSSNSHKVGRLDPTNMNGEQNYSRITFYGNSKLYNIMFAHSLQRRVKKYNITVSCLHPGAVTTNLFKSGAGRSKLLYGVGYLTVHTPFFKTAHDAAAVILHCAVNPDLNTTTMVYYTNSGVSQSTQMSRNVSLQKQLWEMSISAVQEYLSPSTVDKFGGVKKEEEEEEKEVEEERGADGEEGGGDEETGEVEEGRVIRGRVTSV